MHFHGSKGKNSLIYIKAKYINGTILSKKEQDSLISVKIKEISQAKQDSIKLKSITRISYKDFGGPGIIESKYEDSLYSVSFLCTKYFNGGYCPIFYSSNESTKIKRYEKDLAIFYSFIDGIKTYTASELEYEDSLLRESVTIQLDSIISPQDFPNKEYFSYYARLRVQDNKKDILKEVKVPTDFGADVFKIDKNGEIIIACRDKSPGLIEKKCSLIVIDKYGKEVNIQFILRYLNRK